MVTDPEQLLPLLRPYPAEKNGAPSRLPKVNSPRNRGPALIAPLAAEAGR